MEKLFLLRKGFKLTLLRWRSINRAINQRSAVTNQKLKTRISENCNIRREK